MTAVAIQHRDEILKEISDGKLLRQIATQYGITKVAISQALGNDPDYQAALRSQADALIDEAMSETWEARDKVNIARARGMRDGAFRYAESIHSEKWSPKQEIKQTVTHRYEIDVSDVARRIASLMQADAAPQLPQSSTEITDAVIVEDQGNT